MRKKVVLATVGAAAVVFVLVAAFVGPRDDIEGLLRSFGPAKTRYVLQWKLAAPPLDELKARGWHVEPWHVGLGCESCTVSPPADQNKNNIEITLRREGCEVEYSRDATSLERGVHWIQNRFDPTPGR